MKKLLPLVTLTLVLAACSGGGIDPTLLGGRAAVTATAENSSVLLDAASNTSATTNVTFTSSAGSLGVTIKEAVISFPGSNAPAVKVSLPHRLVPSGYTCPNSAEAGSLYFCGIQEEGSNPEARSVKYQYNNSDLFQKAIQANPAARALELRFTGNVYNSSATWTSNPMSFTYTPGGDLQQGAQLPAPALLINNTDPQPYSGILSVTASGGFPAGAQVKKLLLEIVDASGLVDNTTYTSTQPSQTFSVDTSKYPDGNLTLKVVAITQENQTGTSPATTVTVRNLVPPAMQIVSPTSGQSISTSLNASVQLLRKNTGFTILGADGNTANTVKFNIVDYRGSILASKTVDLVQSSTGLHVANTTFDMNSALYPNNIYTLETVTQVRLAGESQARVITQQSQFVTQNSNNKPPAVLLHVPTSLGGSLVPKLGRNSGVFVQMSDDSGLQQLQVQLTCNSATCKDFGTYAYNWPVGGATAFRFVDVGMTLDAQPYVPDADYILRVTGTDSSGNTNIQEVPVTVSRAAAADSIANLGNVSVAAFEDTSSKFTPASATWTLSGSNSNPVRLVTMIYDNSTHTIGVSAPTRMSVDYFPAGGSISDTLVFGEAGQYQVVYLIEDLTTGVVRYYKGAVVTVKSKE